MFLVLLLQTGLTVAMPHTTFPDAAEKASEDVGDHNTSSVSSEKASEDVGDHDTSSVSSQESVTEFEDIVGNRWVRHEGRGHFRCV